MADEVRPLVNEAAPEPGWSSGTTGERVRVRTGGTDAGHARHAESAVRVDKASRASESGVTSESSREAR
ncbi:hypothetical protein [Streptomyces reniochalinae]|uniref:Uncharacterized protein n=1 Tax=Streptomyces reniochalinae TaxID=2250578 RepID=A0A367EVS1_9ACTN|nr:hypothetical protein [Streptomyces reniochalinae]RCG21685.1 hypothetical protein DQ392_08200 [Streptomyces reniochalinae]